MPEGNSIYVIIALTFVGFIALAFVLLYPVYRFMRGQEDLSDDWTPDALARRQREAPGDGAPRDRSETARPAPRAPDAD